MLVHEGRVRVAYVNWSVKHQQREVFLFDSADYDDCKIDDAVTVEVPACNIRMIVRDRLPNTAAPRPYHLNTLIARAVPILR